MAQDLEATQRLADSAANWSSAAGLLTGHHAWSLLAEARPIPQQLGHLRFAATLLRHRTAKARELAAAWNAAVEAWDKATRSVQGEPESADDR